MWKFEVKAIVKQGDRMKSCVHEMLVLKYACFMLTMKCVCFQSSSPHRLDVVEWHHENADVPVWQCSRKRQHLILLSYRTRGLRTLQICDHPSDIYIASLVSRAACFWRLAPGLDPGTHRSIINSPSLWNDHLLTSG
jgi:hypothetical protein